MNGMHCISPSQYIALRVVAQRAEHMRAIATLAEVAFRDLMAAHGLDSSRPYRWHDDTYALEELDHGDGTRQS